MLVLQPPKTSFLSSFPGFLDLSLTNLEWSDSFFNCCLASVYRVQFVKKHNPKLGNKAGR